MQNTIK